MIFARLSNGLTRLTYGTTAAGSPFPPVRPRSEPGFPTRSDRRKAKCGSADGARFSALDRRSLFPSFCPSALFPQRLRGGIRSNRRPRHLLPVYYSTLFPDLQEKTQIFSTILFRFRPILFFASVFPPDLTRRRRADIIFPKARSVRRMNRVRGSRARSGGKKRNREGETK